MIKVQSNSLSLLMEIFTQPCAEQRKSLVEQTEGITVESLLESNDIQPLGNKLRFLVVPLQKELLCRVTLFCFYSFSSFTPHLFCFFGRIILSLHKIGCTRQSESTLSLRSLALSLHKIGCTRQLASTLCDARLQCLHSDKTLCAKSHGYE